MFNAGTSLYPYYAKQGLLKGLTSKINFSSFLTNAQKTLNVVNQTIPLVYQVKPMVNNAKTIFKVIGAVRNSDSNPSENNNYNSNNTTTNNTVKSENITTVTKEKYNPNTQNIPVFFL